MKKILLFTLSLVFLSTVFSCSSSVMKKISSEDFDRLFEIVKTAGADEIMSRQINKDESYRVFLDETEYLNLVDKAEAVYESYGNEGYEALLVFARTKKQEQVFDLLTKRYEWAPCDPAEKIVFAKEGCVILAVKGSRENTEKVYDAFCAFFGNKKCKTVSKER